MAKRNGEFSEVAYLEEIRVQQNHILRSQVPPRLVELGLTPTCGLSYLLSVVAEKRVWPTRTRGRREPSGRFPPCADRPANSLIGFLTILNITFIRFNLRTKPHLVEGVAVQIAMRHIARLFSNLGISHDHDTPDPWESIEKVCWRFRSMPLTLIVYTFCTLE